VSQLLDGSAGELGRLAEEALAPGAPPPQVADKRDPPREAPAESDGAPAAEVQPARAARPPEKLQHEADPFDELPDPGLK
jgi:hypothetical protein